MVIYMEQYAASRAAMAARLKSGTYGDEIMNANWNPALLDMSSEALQASASPVLPEDLSTINVGAFLDRIHALATLI
jgi:hypothetical protein